ncbi:unnamed protein product [Caenorhabditis nigoni]
MRRRRSKKRNHASFGNSFSSAAIATQLRLLWKLLFQLLPQLLLLSLLQLFQMIRHQWSVSPLKKTIVAMWTPKSGPSPEAQRPEDEKSEDQKSQNQPGPTREFLQFCCNANTIEETGEVVAPAFAPAADPPAPHHQATVINEPLGDHDGNVRHPAVRTEYSGLKRKERSEMKVDTQCSGIKFRFRSIFYLE